MRDLDLAAIRLKARTSSNEWCSEDVLRLAAEVERLRRQVDELQGILIDNVHALRTVLHGSSSAMACSPKEAWERTLEELREQLLNR